MQITTSPPLFICLHLGLEFLVQLLELVHLGGLSGPANAEPLLGAWLGNLEGLVRSLLGGEAVKVRQGQVRNTHHVDVNMANLLVRALSIILQDVVLDSPRSNGELLGHGLGVQSVSMTPCTKGVRCINYQELR